MKRALFQIVAGLLLVSAILYAQSTRSVTVTTPGGTFTLSNAFRILPPPPTITAITPSSGSQGTTFDAVITGTNLLGATSVTFSNVGVTAVIKPAGNTATTLNITITVAIDAPIG